MPILKANKNAHAHTQPYFHIKMDLETSVQTKEQSNQNREHNKQRHTFVHLELACIYTLQVKQSRYDRFENDVTEQHSICACRKIVDAIVSLKWATSLFAGIEHKKRNQQQQQHRYNTQNA